MKDCVDFAKLAFDDLLPLAQKMGRQAGVEDSIVDEALALTYEKSRRFPPKHNRQKWFAVVFAEKLREAKATQSARKMKYDKFADLYL